MHLITPYITSEEGGGVGGLTNSNNVRGVGFCLKPTHEKSQNVVRAILSISGVFYFFLARYV